MSLLGLVVGSSEESRMPEASFGQGGEITLHVFAIFVGIVAGLGAVLFRLTIWVAQEAFWGASLDPGAVAREQVPVLNSFDVLAVLGPLRFVVIPAIGGLLVGLLILATTTAIKGHGVPEVMEAIFIPNERIDPKVALYKTIASSIAIGSGGSLGREGPIVQIGSATGSYFGKYVQGKYVRTLIAVGAAGGIAATFNAPLGGIMFALEILLAEYYLQNVIAVVLGAVTATAVARTIIGFTPAPGVREFLVPIHYQLVRPSVEFPLYVVLGLLFAVVGAAVVKTLYGVEHFFDRQDLPLYVKPAIGGALLGVSVLVMATGFGLAPLRAAELLFGVGYHAIRESILGNFTLWVLLGLAVFKTVGFSLTIGSGSSGGVFSPSLYIGAMVGGAFGVVANVVFPGVASPGAYALVGMAGVFAAAASAPLTSSLIIFELTGQYTIILPLLIVCVIGSAGTNRLLHRGTIYTEKLRDEGITAQERRIGSLEDLCAQDVMTTSVDTLPADATVKDAIVAFQRTKHQGLPLVEDDGRLVGIVTLTDLEAELANPVVRYLQDEGEYELQAETDKSALEMGTDDVTMVLPDTNLLLVVDLMENKDIGRVPVVDDDGGIVGIITRSDVLDAYDNLPSSVRSDEPAESPSMPDQLEEGLTEIDADAVESTGTEGQSTGTDRDPTE
ncbi:MAG: chloride channel protein [Haloferacaceae archaeon]